MWELTFAVMPKVTWPATPVPTRFAIMPESGCRAVMTRRTLVVWFSRVTWMTEVLILPLVITTRLESLLTTTIRQGTPRGGPLQRLNLLVVRPLPQAETP